jgi:purine-binding chemotaxis protein CheW
MTAAPHIAEKPAAAAPTSLSVCEIAERVVAFFLGGQRYALPIERVREIQQIVAFSEVPSGSAGVVGMVNLRGNVIPAVDMRRLVGLKAREYTLETPMIIAEVQGEVLALLVDEVQDVFELPASCLQAPPALHELSASMIGVAPMGDSLIYVLDVDQLVGAGLFGGRSR